MFWLIVLIFAAYFSAKKLNLESNILKLLPKYESETTAAMIDKASAKINDKLIVSIVGNDQSTTKQEYNKIIQDFSNSGLFKQVKYEIDINQFQNLYQELFEYRYLMMSNIDFQALEKINDLQYFIDMAAAEMYGMASFDQNQIETDPLFFFSHILNQLSELNQFNIDTDENLFYLEKEQKHHYFAFLQLNESAFSPSYQDRVVSLLNTSKEKLRYENINLLSFGSLRYANNAYQQAKNEISTVGLGSLLGIIFLFLFVFGSVRPLLISIFSIASGLLFALFVTLMVFKQVHLFSLVFGSTIAGVSIDYCFHYLTESLFDQSSNQNNVITKVMPGLSIGFLSSALVYFGFVITGYQVLAQISLFSIMGLFAVLINVLLFFPKVIKQRKRQNSLYLKIGNLIVNNPMIRLADSVYKIVALFALLLIANSIYLNANDDVRALQSLSNDLKAEENYIKDVLTLNSSGRYLLIHAKTIDEILSVEEQILSEINSSKKEEFVIGISDFIPSINKQNKLQEFYERLYSSQNFSDYIEMVGLNKNIIKKQMNALNAHESIDYTIIDSNYLQDLLAQRWLGHVNDYYALAIPLNKDINLQDYPQVVLVQQAEDASQLFSQFRIKAMQIVCAASILLVLMLALFRYGFKKALHLVLIPFSAGLASLLITQWSGLHISLFSILALLLVLGMGLDYVVFLTEAKHKSHIAFALLLSSLTTILSFGLLSLSHVAVIKSFGFSLAVGIFIVLMISPAIINKDKDLIIKG